MIDERLGVESYRSANDKLLEGLFLGDFIFCRSGILELEDLVRKSKAGGVTVSEVVEFIDPSARVTYYSSTTFGLGHQLDQQTRVLEMLAGYSRDTVIDLERQVYTARLNILAALGAPDPHIAIRDEDTDKLTHPNLLIPLGSDEDLISCYIAQVNKLFDFFENLFSAEAVIKKCEREIEKLKKYLEGGYNIRTKKPLSLIESAVCNFKIAGYTAAIERNLKRS